MNADYTNELDRATREMRRVMDLPENLIKEHWLETSPQTLEYSLNNHVENLLQAVGNGRHGVARLEAANVANIAWMIAERSTNLTLKDLVKLNSY